MWEGGLDWLLSFCSICTCQRWAYPNRIILGTGPELSERMSLFCLDLSIDTVVGMATQPVESLSLDLAKFDATCEAVDEDGQLDFHKMEKQKSIFTNNKSNGKMV